MSISPDSFSVATLARGIKSRSISPVDIVESCLERINRLDGKLHAFIDVYEREARLAGEAADKAIRSGHALGPLHGIPIAIKDLADIEGRVTTGGSAIWRERRANGTATLVQKLISAGMIILGKVHTAELAFSSFGTNQHLGTPWNPWDADVHRTPGGSSSGSAVAVAARMVPCAVGTDTGGSVRVPAAWCGITGLKTTIGRISCHGVLANTPTLDTPGPMTLSVEDAALLLEVMQGADGRDPRTLGLEDSDPMPTLRRGVRGLRLARPPAADLGDVDPEVLAAYEEAITQFAARGAEIVDLKLPCTIRQYGEASGRIMAAESYALYARIVDNNALLLDEAVRPRVRAGAGISAREYLEALAHRQDSQREFARAIEGIDALLAPTTYTPAIPIAQVDQGSTAAFLTRWVNFLELSSLAVPIGLSRAGLPLSVQIICRGSDEAMALRIGWDWQNATVHHELVPPMAR
jgi:aspartyl-tRNA(Asn)/glutamyl-tRNA(Gln) amidotransferase subunit A